MAPSDVSVRGPSLLVVAGSGRSGTSLFTGLVSRLGVYIPQPEIKANETNPRGFGEPRWALAFHKEMLDSVDVAHDDARPDAWELTGQVAERAQPRRRLRDWLEEQFAVSDRVVVKDPRLAPFLELYRRVAGDLGVDLSVATMLRHPAETVRSKEMYYGDKLGSAARMAGWLNMMLSVELASRDLPRAVVRFDDLLTRWQPTLAAAERPLAVELTSRATQEQVRAADELVDPGLRRVAPGWAELELPARLRELAERTYQELDARAVEPEALGIEKSEVLDEAREEYARYYRESEAVVRSSIRAARMTTRKRVAERLKAKQAKQGKQRPRPQQHQPGPQGRSGRAPAPATTPAGALKRRAAALLRGLQR
jgi:hypothetical protein